MSRHSLAIDAWIREAEEGSRLVEDLETKFKNNNSEQWKHRDSSSALSKLLEIGVKLDRLESLLRNPPSKPILTKEDVEFRWKILSDIRIRTRQLALSFSMLPSPGRKGSCPAADIKETKRDGNELEGVKFSSSIEDIELLKPLISEDVACGQVQNKGFDCCTSWSTLWKACSIGTGRVRELVLVLDSVSLPFMASWVLSSAASVTVNRRETAGFLLFPRRSVASFRVQKNLWVRSSLDTDVSDMSVNAPKGLFPPEPEHYRGPKLKVAIIGAGLAGMSTAVELLEQGHEVDIYESRKFIGGKVGSFVDKRGNHVEMGLHVFFGCYNNLFRLMKKVGAEKNLLVKDHTHTFVNKGGEIGELDFRFPVGAPLHGIRAFLSTNQLKTYDKARNAMALALSPVVRALVDPDGAMRDIRNLDSISFSDWFLSKGGTRMSIQRMWDPVAYALGFIDCDNISARCMLTIFSLFATKTEASLLRMLKGSPDVYLSGPIRKYITDKGGRFHLRWGCREILYDKSSDGEIYVTGMAMSKATNKKIVKADAYVAACDVPGIKRLIPQQWRESKFFSNIYELVGVPVITVQLRYNGWVTELQDLERSRQLRQAAGIDNLLYTPDADFSCFADLALSSPEDYYVKGQGSLLQCVLTPGDPYMPLPNDEIVARVAKQVLALFPSSQGLEVTWSSVVKIGQSLYREGPGKDPFRPDQKTPVRNFFLAGSYTKQDYIDSMEGATLSGRQASAYICDAGEELVALRKKIAAIDSQEHVKATNPDQLSLV
ncbi:hypothetical protein FNV43_RR04794 [Rhamnella rubrinervis]|uniref:Zeta-carotene desaturase n=1 Tax=Rhamnella rubrinervis TaxID=2594499 RepID=A0A8K0HKF6_9ROSA|nr:hypothetical protein FNV43_RR04794 [Rhamnella rubrinervis]